MSFYQPTPTLSKRFRLVQASFLQSDGLPLADVLPAERIEEVCAEAGVQFAADEDAVYTPAVTLWAFLSQALGKEELRRVRDGRLAGDRPHGGAGAEALFPQHRRLLPGAGQIARGRHSAIGRRTSTTPRPGGWEREIGW